MIIQPSYPIVDHIHPMIFSSALGVKCTNWLQPRDVLAEGLALEASPEATWRLKSWGNHRKSVGKP